MTQSPEKLFSDVEKFVEDSRAMLRRGDILQLDGLDAEVKRLCEAILQLSQDERVQHTETLQKLLKDLSALGDEMAQQRDEIAGQIQGLSEHKQAHIAYKKADATDDFGKKNDSDT